MDRIFQTLCIDTQQETIDRSVVMLDGSFEAAVVTAESQSSQQREINRLRCDVAYWRAMHGKAVRREKKLREEIADIEAKLSLRERQLFGRRSERHKGPKSGSVKSGGQQDGRSTSRRRGQQPGAPGHGRRLHKNLPVVPVTFGFLDNEQKCTRCGLPFDELPMTEDSEEVVVEVRAHRRVYKRTCYTPTCQCPSNPGIITAAGPSKLIPKGSLHLSFWVLALLDKFLFQRPTYRLLEQLRLTLELDIPQGTVTGGLKRLAPLFEPLYEALCARNVSESLWHADETRWLVFVEMEGKRGQAAYG